MDSEMIYHSPVICYEISKSNKMYQIDVYLQGHKESTDPKFHSILRDFSDNSADAKVFAEHLCANCALPIHIPELAEEFLSVNTTSEFFQI